MTRSRNKLEKVLGNSNRLAEEAAKIPLHALLHEPFSHALRWAKGEKQGGVSLAAAIVALGYTPYGDTHEQLREELISILEQIHRKPTDNTRKR